jgi:hydrogenase 3 maturation protease
MDLHGFPAWKRPARVALVGIGNELNGDDAVGVRVVRSLAARLGPREDLLLLEAGTAPENFTGPLRRFRPDLVLLFDAASFDQPAGATMTIDWADIDGCSASTHTLPPSVFGRFLVEELGCRLALVGIQPARLDFGEPLSAPVMAAADRLVVSFERWLTAVPGADPA